MFFIVILNRFPGGFEASERQDLSNYFFGKFLLQFFQDRMASSFLFSLENVDRAPVFFPEGMIGSRIVRVKMDFQKSLQIHHFWIIMHDDRFREFCRVPF